MTSPVRAVRPLSQGVEDPPSDAAQVVLALGSNLGEREAVLRSAVAGLSTTAGLAVHSVSPVVETEPVGGPVQDPYLNAVVLAATTLSPAALLALCQRIEAEHGRERNVRWGARTLDIDIISYGELVCETANLILPHPRAHLRAFVLVPWSQADPTAVLVGPGGGAVSALAAAADDRDGVRAFAGLDLNAGGGTR